MCKSQLSITSWNVEGLKSSLDYEDFFIIVHNFDLVFCSESNTIPILIFSQFR